MRFPSRSTLLIASFSLALLAACNREQAPTVKTTDSTSTSVTVTPAQPATDSTRAATGEPAPGSVKPVPDPNSFAAANGGSDSIRGQVLSDDDPIAKKMLEAMRGRPAGPRPAPGPVTQRNVIPSAKLTELQPKIPGYEFVEHPSNFDGQGQGRSTALLRSTTDPSKTIRSIIKSEDETFGSSFGPKVNELKQAGSLTDYSQGEPITAYYLQVGGMPAARAYIPSKHVATLTVFVGDHRLIQLREDKVNSSDHLVEVSKYLDVKRLAALQP